MEMIEWGKKKKKSPIPIFSTKYLSLFKGEKLFPKQHIEQKHPLDPKSPPLQII
jgi:hypothetical protein